MILHLEIRVPEQIVLQREVAAIQAGDTTGRFGLRPGHEPFMTVLNPGIVFYRDAEGRDGYVAVDGGVLLLEKEHVSIATRDAVVAPTLDAVADAATKMIAARQAEEHLARVAAERIAARLLRELRKAQP